MKKRRKLKKGLALVLTAAMVVGLLPGVGTLQVSATESDENTVNTVSSNEAMTPEQTDGQATDKLITAWEWIDEEEILDEETGNLALPGANEQKPAYFDDVTAFLPTQIQATVVNAEDTDAESGEEIINLGDWNCEDYPEEGAYSGSYIFTATLPEGYVLSEKAKALAVTVELGGAQTYESAEGITVGDFTVTGGENVGYEFNEEERVLRIWSGDTPITIANTNKTQATTDRIEVMYGTNITLAGVNIDVSSSDTAAFKIADECRENVTITLADNSENTLISGSSCAGLQMSTNESQKLTIQGGTNGTGKLTATGGSGGAGIGGGYGGTGSNITIEGGTVNATSEGDGAGIGGGMYSNYGGSGGTGSNITISGGTVTATSDSDGAGIGGGSGGTGSNITINGGTVTATSHGSGAGIGGGSGGTGSNITINGGTVTATSHGSGAGIGGGSDSSGSNITIEGGIVTATSSLYGAGIGGGGNGSGGTGTGSDITITGGTVTATGGLEGAGIGGGSGGTGSSITIEGGIVTATSDADGAGIGGGSDSTGSNITISGGTVTATSKCNGAGIGGGNGGTGSNITISGGIVTATGGTNYWNSEIFGGAGIGGGSNGTGSSITISGGSVKAVAGTNANDIGGGSGQSAVTPTNDGTTPVYLLTIENPDSKEVLIDGKSYKPVNHKAVDENDTKLYAYLPAKTVTEPNVVQVGTERRQYFYEDSKWYIVAPGEYDENGFCTNYEWKNGSLVLKDGTVDYNHTGCKGYQPANITTGKHEVDGNSSTEDEVYEITNAGQLYWFAGLVNGGGAGACAKLMTDITVNKDVLMADGTVNTEKISSFRSWTPIGNPDYSYTGIFDGDNHTISGLYLNDVNSDYVGLFGYVAGPQDYEGPDGIISNVGIVDSYFNGKDKVGGISGYNGEKIINCYNLGTVSGKDNVGGISGHNDGTINNCHNTGNIKGNQYVGGVSGGNNYHYGGCISNCYNLGTVRGTDYVGGVCGGNFCITVNCYNAGTVTATGENAGVGGVCGYREKDTTVNCYYIDEQETDKIEGTTFKKGGQFASGEVAYLLAQDFTINGNNIDGSVWGQKLGNDGDAYPVLKKAGDEGNTVYQNETYAGCEGNKGELVYSYSNTQEDPVYAEHTIGEDGICSICNQKIKYKVSLTSTVDGTDEEDTVALLTGGGLYTIGTEATVTAPEKEGFTFKGWYNSGYVENDEPRSKKLSYTFTPEADTSLVAVYVANASITLNVNGDSNAYSVNGTTQTSNSFTQSFKAGSSITVAYTGSGTFCYWKNESGKIVSKNPEYTFTIVNVTTLTAVVVGDSTGSEETGYSALVEFVSCYGQIIEVATWNSKDTAAEKTLPAAPSKLGGTFKYWSLDGVSEATAGSILAAINGTATRITVVPVYEEIATTHKVTIKYPSDLNKDDAVYDNQKLGNTLTVTADSIEGKEFAYWSSDKDGTTKLSYSQSYFLLVSGDTTLYPIYSGTVVEQQPVVAITNVFKSSADDKHILSFEVTRSVPAKYELVEQGIIYSASNTYATGETAMVIGADSVYKTVSSDTKNNGVFIANMNVTGHEASKLYVKGYVVIKNKETGNIETIYTDMADKSYNDLAQN